MIFGKTLLFVVASIGLLAPVLAAPIPQPQDTSSDVQPLADGDHGDGIIIFHGVDIGQQGDTLVDGNIVTEDGEITSEQDVLDGFAAVSNTSDAPI